MSDMTGATADWPSLAGAARLIRTGKLSPVALTEQCIDRVQRLDPELCAFATFTPERARTAARVAEREIADGRWRGPLHGMPVGFKDVIDVAGDPTRAQSRQTGGYVAERDAAVAAHWFDAGAVSLGKLTTHEFAFGGPARDVPGAPARNPWQRARFAGGSSSGAAVGVAAGMLMGAAGTDTAGSVRSPAALCGVTGFKPGRAATALRGCMPLAASLDTLGVIARSAEDCALLWSASAGLGRAEDTTGLDAGIRGLRIGVVRNFWRDVATIAGGWEDVLDRALSVFGDAGAQVQDVVLPPLEDWNAAGMIILLAEAFAQHAPWLRDCADLYGRSFRDAVMIGALIGAADYVDALRAKHALVSELEHVMLQCDLLIAPVQPGEAPYIEAVSQWGFLERPSFGIPFNMSDSPALSLCCGFGSQGLPLALQLVGRPGEEHRVLAAGHAFQVRTDWHLRRPALF